MENANDSNTMSYNITHNNHVVLSSFNYVRQKVFNLHHWQH